MAETIQVLDDVLLRKRHCSAVGVSILAKFLNSARVITHRIIECQKATADVAMDRIRLYAEPLTAQLQDDILKMMNACVTLWSDRSRRRPALTVLLCPCVSVFVCRFGPGLMSNCMPVFVSAGSGSCSWALWRRGTRTSPAVTSWPSRSGGSPCGRRRVTYPHSRRPSIRSGCLYTLTHQVCDSHPAHFIVLLYTQLT